jgi:hypothetical protein
MRGLAASQSFSAWVSAISGDSCAWSRDGQNRMDSNHRTVLIAVALLGLIASMVAGDLATAFRLRFGMTPREYRKGRGQEKSSASERAKCSRAMRAPALPATAASGPPGIRLIPHRGIAPSPQKFGRPNKLFGPPNCLAAHRFSPWSSDATVAHRETRVSLTVRRARAQPFSASIEPQGSGSPLDFRAAVAPRGEAAGGCGTESVLSGG